MTSSGYAKHRMRENNNTEHRHEQFVLQNYFKIYAPKIETEQEYRVYKEVHGLPLLIAILDLADLTNKIAWRLHGEIHQGLRKRRDEDQKLLLEEEGWVVIDCYKDSFKWAWLWSK